MDACVYTYICSSTALKMLGFVTRIALRVIICPPPLKLGGYCSLIRSILEYGPVVVDPSYTVNDIRQLKRVKRKFFNFVQFILDINCLVHDYTTAANHLNHNSLVNRKGSAANFRYLHNGINSARPIPQNYWQKLIFVSKLLISY